MQIDRLEVLDRLIAAGWGFHPGNKIPAAVVRAAENLRAVVPRADTAEADRFKRLGFDENGETVGPKPIVAKVCVICGAEHKRHNSAKTCSYACAEKLRAQSVAAETQRWVVPPSERVCVQCGATFVGHSQFSLCSDECRKERRKVHLRNDVRVRSEHRRKAMENYMQNRPGMMDFAGKTSTKTLEYKQEDSHA